MARTHKSDTMRACSVRLPQALHAHLLEEAEKRGSTVGDVMRDAIERFREQQALSEQIAALESRFFRKVFETQCAVAGLTQAERAEVLSNLKQRMQGGAA